MTVCGAALSNNMRGRRCAIRHAVSNQSRDANPTRNNISGSSESSVTSIAVRRLSIPKDQELAVLSAAMQRGELLRGVAERALQRPDPGFRIILRIHRPN